MTTESKLRIDVARAGKAQQLLDDEILIEAFAGLEAAYTEAWRSSPIMDSAGREKLFIAINVIGKVKQHLGSIVANGKLADAELRAMTEDEKRKKRFGIV